MTTTQAKAATTPTKRKPRRRSNGEGSVFFVPTENRWRANFYDADGHRRSLSRKTRAEADKALRKALEERDQGTLGMPGSAIPTLAVWLEQWLQRKQDNVRYKTYVDYQRSVRRVPERLGRLRLDQIRPEPFEAWYRELRHKQGLSASTVRGLHGALDRALKDAVKRGYLLHNPLAHVDRPRLEHEERTPLTVEQARLVLQKAAERGEAARWQLALLLGMRQGEVLGLRWQDVDLEGRRIHVRNQAQRQGEKGIVLIPPKSRAGKRVLEIGDGLVAALREQRRQQHLLRLAAGSEWSDLDFVFATSRGTPVDQRNDYRSWKSLLRAAGVPSVRLHDARHTAASIVLEQGVDPRTLMEILGHSQISLTLNTYAHVSTKLMRGAAEALETAVLERQTG